MTAAPDSTAVRTALWRALHVLVDDRPPVLDDELGLRLVAPDDVLTMVREAGFAKARHVASRDLAAPYFGDRTDGLRPSSGEDLVVATS